MSTLNSLKLTAAKKPTQHTPAEQRRNKLILRLNEQVALATALADGKEFHSPRVRTVTDKATGTSTKVVGNKRVKAWWFTADNGKLALCIKYGAKVLELGKGKFAVEVATEKELVATLEIIKSAVLAGELDAAINSAAGKLRDGFKG
ncbi:MAG: hypothetical protein QE285_14755 [Aquabacterium sp.]|nr:hypothetical protein [Aquabacterium sp.]